MRVRSYGERRTLKGDVSENSKLWLHTTLEFHPFPWNWELYYYRGKLPGDRTFQLTVGPFGISNIEG